MDSLNPSSLAIVPEGLVEPWLLDEGAPTTLQFMRQGYFHRDPTVLDRPVFNRTVSLRGGWEPEAEEATEKVERRAPRKPKKVDAERADQAAASAGATVSANTREWVRAAMAAHPAEVERFRGGEQKLIGFFIGAAKKASRGEADPNAVRLALDELLGD